MNATLTHDILYLAAADGDFRSELLENPAAFGVRPDQLPAAVEQPDQEALTFWTEDVTSTDVFMCWSSCSYGPWTIICDGTTK